MRLVQRAMLPRSGPEHLAEVFLSGLLIQASGTDAVTDPDSVLYEFRDDVREQLLGGLTRRESLRVLEVLSGVSGVVAERFGGSLDFRAFAPHPRGTLSLPAESLPFTQVARAVLQGMGGGYAELAATLTTGTHTVRQAGTARNGGIPAPASALRRQAHTRGRSCRGTG